MDRFTFLDPQLAVARRYVEQHKDKKGTRAAFELVAELFNYTAQTALTADQRLQQAWTIQRQAGAQPAEVLARAVAFLLFLDRRPGYFKSQRAEDVALGRLVLHSVSMSGHRWSATVYAPAGVMVRELLGVFATSLIAKVNRDADRVQRLKRLSAEL